MNEIIERYRVLSAQLTCANCRIKCIRRIVARNNYPFNLMAVENLVAKIEAEKLLINADIDSLAYQIPITQHF